MCVTYNICSLLNLYKPTQSQRNLRHCPSVCERSGILLNVCESQPTFSCMCSTSVSILYSKTCWVSQPHILLLVLVKVTPFSPGVVQFYKFQSRKEKLLCDVQFTHQHGLSVDHGSQFDRLVLLPWSACPQWPLLWNGTEETGLRSFHSSYELEPAGHKDTGWTSTAWKMEAHLQTSGVFAVHSRLSSAHLEFDVIHGHQFTFLTDAEGVCPVPVGNGLCPGEVVPILDHLCDHFVVCLGAKKSCCRGRKSHPILLWHLSKEANVCTNRIQKLLVIFLSLQLVYSSESHGGKVQRMAQEKTLWQEIRSGRLQAQTDAHIFCFLFSAHKSSRCLTRTCQAVYFSSLVTWKTRFSATVSLTSRLAKTTTFGVSL